MKNQHFFVLLIVIIIISGCNKPKVNPTLTGYSERSKCISCHEDIYYKYIGSHHDLAMELANEESVLGNFDTTITHLGDAAMFYKKDGGYYVYTKGENGIYKDYKVSYTFGWTPLQQYLIEFPKGSYQVLPFCWDTRPKKEGGQRWFHIYDKEKIPHDDFLYWTAKQQNWNHVCAECHSTNLHKNFNIDSLAFNTNWTEIDVSCDACHGPSANHMEWAKLNEKGKNTSKYPNLGYAFSFPNDSAEWVFDEKKGTAFRSKERKNHQLIEICARCHSRRFQIWDDYIHGEELMQSHIPDILEPRLYYFDGQIKEEDYVYGSFLQSKMYRRGVECIDCHDPHTYQIKAPGNILCATCHMNNKYNNATHHFHADEANGGSCRDCHMPMTKYMVIDHRYDHSLRIPRPDLSLKTGVPNACNKCHDDKSVEWANEWFRKWYGTKYDTIGHYGIAFYAAYNKKENAFELLQDVINDTSYTDIVKATAVYYLQYVPSNKTLSLARQLTNHKSPLVRQNAMRTLSIIDASNIAPLSVKLMYDSVRAVRYEAMLAYSHFHINQLTPHQRKKFTQYKLDEYIKMLYTNNDQAASHINLGLYYINRGKTDSTLLFYQKALAVDSTSVEVLLNIADIYREHNRDEEGLKVLLSALHMHPDRPEVYNALGMLYTRQNNSIEALTMFKKSYDLMPDNTYYIYIYAIALNSSGNRKEALELLEQGFTINPYDQNILYGLTALYRDAGNQKKAAYYYNRLTELIGQN